MFSRLILLNIHLTTTANGIILLLHTYQIHIPVHRIHLYIHNSLSFCHSDHRFDKDIPRHSLDHNDQRHILKTIS